MKKMICLLLGLLMLLGCLTGCDGSTGIGSNTVDSSAATLEQAGESSHTVGQESPSSDVAAAVESVVVENPSSGQYPPLQPDLVTFYQNTLVAYERVASCGHIACDSSKTYTVDGNPYYCLVTDQTLDTYAEFRTYLEGYFTKEYASKLLADSDHIKQGPNGETLMLDAGRGSDITYAGHVFHAKQTGNRVDLWADVYYTANDQPYDGTPFYVVPTGGGYRKEVKDGFTMVKTDKGWRYSQFELVI